jgi:hypothetical protein
MKSLYAFIVSPYEERYNNKKKVGGAELILNNNIESFQHISKKAIVVATPAAFKTPINPGDTVMIHHNIFRRYYGIDGEEKNGSLYFKDNLYFAQMDQVYAYNDGSSWKANLDYCFIKPIKNKSAYKAEKEQTNIGILKYGNSFLNELKINPGSLVGYTPYGEFEFIIDDERLYCMKSNDIVIKYEYQGNEVEYNPSWASSS